MHVASRKVMISLLLTLFAAIVLTSSTYAWFSMNKDNFADGLELSIITDSDIELSLDGINFANTIANEQLLAIIGSQIKLKDVTSNDGINFSNSAYTQEEDPVANRDYITFDIWFRTKNSVYKSIYLAENVSPLYNYDVLKDYELNATYAISEGVVWKADITFDNGNDAPVEKGTSDIYYGANAIRIAFTELLVEEELLASPDERTNLEHFIFDPSEDETRSYGIAFGAYAYAKLKNAGFPSLPTTVPNTIYALSKFINPYTPLSADSKIASLQKGAAVEGKTYYYAKATVSIWLEGWDADCFDSILEDNIVMQLKFQGVYPTR